MDDPPQEPSLNATTLSAPGVPPTWKRSAIPVAVTGLCKNRGVPKTANTPEHLELPVDELDLDPRNPRIIVEEDASQLDLIEYLYSEEGIDDLVTSLVENGYFTEEPLVAVRNGPRYTVVEGNRRLATLKLLLDKRLRRQLAVADWPNLTSTQRERLQRVPVVVHSHRSEVLAFLGYRHITGARKWAPFQKSRFVAQLVEEGYDLSGIQDLIGDSTQAVKKLYQEFVVFRQVAEDLDIDTEPIRVRFSLLEVSLGQRPIKAYLGMPTRLPGAPVERLIGDEYLDHLEQIVGWVFGAGRWPIVITESRDINEKLSKVIASESALEWLIESGDLDMSYELTDGEQVSLLRRLAAAERSIRAASGILPLYNDDPEIIIAVERVSTLAASLKRQLKK